MAPTPNEQELRARFAAAGQEHVFTFYQGLGADDKQALLKQLATIDPAFCNTIFKAATGGNATPAAAQLAPLPESGFATTIGRATNDTTAAAWHKAGMTALKAGKVGVILMAGGQGTRLGSTAPKGCYDIGMPSQKSLFQMQAERIARMQTLSGAVIPWYVMALGGDTKAYFEAQKYFGLDPANVIFFEQGTLPAFDMQGKILLETQGRVSVAPDGNGGIYRAMREHGILADMQRRGIQYLHAYCVDNCLVRVADPVFIGYCIAQNAHCGAKVVRKTQPNESVGVICLRNGRPAVVEYSEMDAAVAERRTADGEHLAFRAANIANHFYTLEFLQRVAQFEAALEYHVAKKKIKHVALSDGTPQAPKEPNGIKLELFVFDVFPRLEPAEFAVLEVARSDEFSPLKNAPGAGVDCPETSRADLMRQHARFLADAGAVVASGSGDVPIVEISALVSYAGEGLESLSGRTLHPPVLIQTAKDLERLSKA